MNHPTMKDVYIVAAVRTPMGKFGGSLKDHSPVDLAAHVMRGALDAARIDGSKLDFYAFGNVLRAGHGQLIPRQAALKAGIPEEIDGVAVDMVCSSGMMSLMTGASLIRSGDAEVILTGGVESMSATGFYLSSRARWGYKFLMGAPEEVKDLLLYDGLTDPMSGEAMGVQTERLAAEWGIGRTELDEVAVASHVRANAASEDGRFDDEIVPIPIRVKKETVEFGRDEGIRADTTLEGLSSLRPAFGGDGVLTAGNSSQISDGAAAILIASGEAVSRLGLKPIGKLLGGAWSAGPSWRFSEAPIPAVQKLLERIKRSIGDFQLFENNEAFAINSILFNRMLGVSAECLNVNGGAIALGHPIGCSGSRILVTLIHALRNNDGESGIASICHGTGGGTAVAIERA
ncbi:MAG TPA: thiolase family protein [Rhodothermales bacterium]